MPTDTAATDETLMLGYHDGDVAAFDVLYGRHKGGAGVSASAKPAAPAAALSAAPARSALWQDLVKAPPEKWVQRIAELRRDGKTADADALAAEFRRRFPDARLPEDLR